jgi:hypothetical protein
MGVAFGIFMGAMDPAALNSPNPLAAKTEKTAMQVLKETYRTTKARSVYASTYPHVAWGFEYNRLVTPVNWRGMENWHCRLWIAVLCRCARWRAVWTRAGLKKPENGA